MMIRRPLAIAACLALGLVAPPLAAQMHGPGWGGPGWGRSGDPFFRDDFPSRLREPRTSNREGKIEIERFIKRGAQDELGSGAVVVDARVSGMADDEAGATYESALVDQFVKLGYDTQVPATASGQRAQLQVIRAIAEPAEQKRSPVSGESTIGISNRGTYYGLGLSLDFTKPRTALLSTRMNVRIVDVKTDQTIWEGHATLYSRDGDDDYSEDAIARRLASALFAEFPIGPDDTIVG